MLEIPMRMPQTFNSKTCTSFISLCEELIRKNGADIILTLNFSFTEEIDSFALASLVVIDDSLKRHDGYLQIKGVSGQVKKKMEDTKFDESIPFSCA